MRIIPLLALSALALSVTVQKLNAQSVPATINYQGRLTDNSPAQNPVNATVPMSFAIYDAASAGTQLWLEPASGGTSVLVVNGIFNVALGGNGVAIPASVFTGATSTRYLEITTNPGTPGAEILAPRQLIGASGYAHLAQNANSAATAATAINTAFLGGVPAAGYLQTTQTAADSSQLGGVPAAGWQKGLTLATCPVGKFYNAIDPGGTATCATPADPASHKFQTSWTTQTNIAAGVWGNLTSSSFSATTKGGALLVFMHISFNGGSHATCRPMVDGVWAGSFGGLPNPGDPFWQEGLEYSAGGNWHSWTPTRLYPGVPAGIHTFSVQCATDGGVLSVCGSSVGCSWGFLELT